MANFADTLKKLLFQAGKVGVDFINAPFNRIAQQVEQYKASLPQNEQNGVVAGLNALPQVTRIVGNNLYKDVPIANNITSYVTNRMATPAADIPRSFIALKNIPELLKKNDYLNAGMTAISPILNTVYTAANMTSPIATQQANQVFTGLDTIKGMLLADRKGKNKWEAGVRGFTGEEVPGLGNVLTDNPEQANIINAGEQIAGMAIPAIHGMLSKRGPKETQVAESNIDFGQKIDEVNSQIAKIQTQLGKKISNTKRVQLTEQLSQLNKINTAIQDFLSENMGQKPKVVKPEIVGNYTPLTEGMQEMLTRERRPYMETIPVEGGFTPLDKVALAEKYAQSASKPPFETVPLEGETQITQPSQKSVQGYIPPVEPPKEAPTVLEPIKELGSGETPPTPPKTPKKGIFSGEFIDKIKLAANKKYTELVNRYHPMESMAEQGGVGEKMKRNLSQVYGSGSIANSHIDELRPMLQKLEGQGISGDDMTKAMTALHDIELKNAGIQGSNTGDPITNLNDLKTKLGPEKMKILGDTITQTQNWYNGIIQKYLVDTGVISQKAWAEMRAKYQFYVPFKRVMDEMDKVMGFTPGKQAGNVSSQNVIYGIKGSERPIVNPMESMIENVYKAVGIGSRQEVAKTIYEAGQKMPEIFHEIHGEVGKNEPTISFFDNGVKRTFHVPPDVADAAKSLSVEALQGWVKVLAIPARSVRLTATQINPEFWGTNIARDLPTAFVNAGLNPFKFIEGLSHLIKRDDVYQDFMRYGGRTSSIALDQPFLKRTAEGLFKKGGVEIKNAGDLVNVISNIAEYSEQPTRIAAFNKAFKEALASGMDRETAGKTAAVSAQEATVNFGRYGSKTRGVSSLIPFLNARLQGIDQLVRSGIKDPKGIAARLTLITQIPALLTALNNTRFKTFNDPRVLSQMDKDNNYIFMLSDTPIDIGPLKGIRYLKIPKGDVGKFSNMTERFINRLSQIKGGDEILPQIAKEFMSKEALSDFMSFSPFNNMGDFMPAAFKPFYENASNFNFFRQTSIVPEYAKSFPAGYQASQYTPEFYKAVGQRLGISPAQIENVGSSYFTGMEKLAMPLLDKLAPMIAGGQQIAPSTGLTKGADINRTPILRRWLGGEKKSEDEATTENTKKANAIDFKISDLKSGVKKGYIPADIANKSITQLLDQKLQMTGANAPTVTNPQTIEEIIQKKLQDTEKESTIKQYLTRSIPVQQSISDLLQRGFTQTDINNAMMSELKSAKLEDKTQVVSKMLQSGQASISQLYSNGVLTTSVAKQMERDGLIKDADSLIQKMKLTDTYYQNSQIRKAQKSSMKKLLTKQKSALKKVLTKKAKTYKMPKIKVPKLKTKSYKVKVPKLKL